MDNNLSTTEDPKNLKDGQENQNPGAEEKPTDEQPPEPNNDEETKVKMRKQFEAKLKQQREEFEAKYQEANQKAQTTEEKLQQFEKKLELKEKQLQVKEVLYNSEVDPEFYDFVSEKLMKAENPEDELKSLIESKPKLKKAVEEIRKPSFTTPSSSSSKTMSKDKALEIIEKGDNVEYQKYAEEIAEALK